MRIACVGGGPAGLFFSILASRLGRVREITVYERLPAGATYGWGVVFSGKLLDQLDKRDPETASAVRRHAFRWEDQVVEVTGRAPVRIPSHGYSISRHRLLELLARRATELGVEIRYRQDVHDPSEIADADLVIASDGANSSTRASRQNSLGTAIGHGANKYVWLGTSRVFSSFTFPMVATEVGWIWAHAYGFCAQKSTFVVETTPQTWRALGFDQMTADATMQRLEQVFADHLDGQHLWPQTGTYDGARWLQFRKVTNKRWYADKLVLIGDAAHTAHFTIGSGTGLALQDTMALTDALRKFDRLDEALESYSRCRQAALRPTLRTAANSARWFEQLPRYVEADRFADLLLRRRSAFQSYLPAPVFLRLSDAALGVPLLTNPVRKAVAHLLSVRA